MRCLAEDGRYTIAEDMKNTASADFCRPVVRRSADRSGNSADVSGVLLSLRYPYGRSCLCLPPVSGENRGYDQKYSRLHRPALINFLEVCSAPLPGNLGKGRRRRMPLPRLSSFQSLPIHHSLSLCWNCAQKPVLHRTVCTKDTMEQELLRALGLLNDPLREGGSMTLFAIGDVHLSLGCDKPMDVFHGWDNYVERLEENWNRKITSQDTVLLCGDSSWGMTLQQALEDFRFLDRLPGKKLLLKGNHDYWWRHQEQNGTFFLWRMD